MAVVLGSIVRGDGVHVHPHFKMNKKKTKDLLRFHKYEDINSELRRKKKELEQNQ